MGAAEFLAVQEQAAQAPQLGDVLRLAQGQEGVARQRQGPERIGNVSRVRWRAARCAGAAVATSGASAARHGSRGGHALEAVTTQAQHLGAGGRAVDIPVAEHLPVEARGQGGGARPMGMAMQHPRGAGIAQAGHRGGRVEVGPPTLRAASGCGPASLAWRMPALSFTRSARGRARKSCWVAGSRVQARSAGRARRPGTVRRHGSAAAACDQARSSVGSARACTPTPARNCGVIRKSRLPTISATCRCCAASRQHLDALPLEVQLHGIGAVPELEQVAQDEHRVGRRAAHVRRPGLEGAGQRLAQVKVGNEIDRLPGLRCPELDGRRQHTGSGIHHGRSACLSRSRPRARSSPPPAARRHAPPCCRCAPSRSHPPPRCPRPRGRRRRSPSPARFRP